MCGRFVLYSLPPELQDYFDVRPITFEISPNYNVAPTQEIPVIVRKEDGRHLEKRRWGLVPFWAKDTSIGSRMINARIESVATKPSFKAAIRHRRCLIPANGFFEWKREAGGKQPFFLSLPSGEPLAFAGLWEVWRDKDAAPDQEPYVSCTIITTAAGESIKDLHDRMPLILAPEAYEEWLNPENRDPAQLERFLKSSSVTQLKRYPVSKLVNRVENNSADCIKPLQDESLDRVI
jgi:putative SOS response-associated peptidase YedK